MTTDFPCVLCGDTGPHQVIHVLPPPGAAPDVPPWPPLICCGGCQNQTWPPHDGDGLAEPDLSYIRPELRNLAHRALDERDAAAFLILADSHLRTALAEHNCPLLKRLELWDDIVLGHIRLTSTADPPQAP